MSVGGPRKLQQTQVSERVLPNAAQFLASPPFNMATPETGLLADFDFDLTSNANATPLVPRPPTPDPRRTPTPHPPRRSKQLPLPTDTAPKRLRKKPTAIFVGSEPKGQDPVHNKPFQAEAQPFFDFVRPSHHILRPNPPSPSLALARFGSTASIIILTIAFSSTSIIQLDGQLGRGTKVVVHFALSALGIHLQPDGQQTPPPANSPSNRPFDSSLPSDPMHHANATIAEPASASAPDDRSLSP